MKKSLILSVVMTLVLVISMSTATFAWYTANNQVIAYVNTITASKASGNLVIEMAEGEEDDSTIENKTVATRLMTGVFPPLAPNKELKQAADFTTMANWNTARVDPATGSVLVGSAEAGNYVTGTIKLTNDSDQATGAITVAGLIKKSASSTKNIAAKVKWALVINGSTIITSGYSVSEIGENNIATQAENDVVASESNVVVDSLVTGTTVNIAYYIWLDGWDLTNYDMDASVDATFTFNAAAAA